MISSTGYYITSTVLHTSSPTQKFIEAPLATHLHELLSPPSQKKKTSVWFDFLHQYLALVQLSREALEKFKFREMSFFDPLVGDNACQIRAAMLAKMCRSRGVDELVHAQDHTLQCLAEKLYALLNSKQDKSKTFLTFEEFLNQHKLILEIPEEIYILITSYLLTKSKCVDYNKTPSGELKRQERLSPAKLSEETKTGALFNDKLLVKCQIGLSECSALYIQRIASNLLLSNEISAARLVFGENVKRDIRHRAITPFYASMRLLLQDALERGVPLVVKVSQYVKGSQLPYADLSIVFEPIRSTKNCRLKYAQALPNQNRLKEGALFFYAKNVTSKDLPKKNLERQLLDYNVSDLILSACADHPQHASNDSFRPDDPACENHRKFAHEKGTSRDHPTPLFLPEHVTYGTSIDFTKPSEVCQEIAISKYATCKELYEIITEQGKMPIDRLSLIYNGKPIGPSSQTLEEKGINEGAIIGATIVQTTRSRFTHFERLIPNKKFRLSDLESGPLPPRLQLDDIRQAKGDINEIRMLLKGRKTVCLSLFKQAFEEKDAILQIQLSQALFGMKWGKDSQKDFSKICVNVLESFSYYPKDFRLYDYAYKKTIGRMSVRDSDKSYTRANKTFQAAAHHGYLPAILEVACQRRDGCLHKAARLRPFLGKGERLIDYYIGLGLKNKTPLGSKTYYEGLYLMHNSGSLSIKFPDENESFEAFCGRYKTESGSIEYYEYDGFQYVRNEALEETVLAPSKETWMTFVSEKLQDIQITPETAFLFKYPHTQHNWNHWISIEESD